MRLLYQIVLLTLLCCGSAAAQPPEERHVTVQLVSEDRQIAPGADTWLGLHIAPENGWHVYWHNPGDTGLPTRIKWSLPAGVSAGAIRWPYPERSELAGLINFGYSRDTTLLIPLHVPANWAAGQPVKVQAKASWLVCKTQCIPGSQQLTLQLPTGAATIPDPAQATRFAQARSALPQPLPDGWQARFATRDGAFSLGVSGAVVPPGAHVDFIPDAGNLLDYPAPMHAVADSNGLRLTQPLSRKFTSPPQRADGVLIVSLGAATQAWAVSAASGEVAAVDAADANLSAAGTSPHGASPPGASPYGASMQTPPAHAQTSLGAALLAALLGGLILNLMPCVFPVLSLKALALAHAGAKEHRQQRIDALAYTAGVILAFAGLAAALLALRAAGRAVGWGFQLQNPIVVTVLAYLLFALGLSMSGVFSFGTRWMGIGQRLTELGGVRGSFFTGVLAVVVASPCTVPFMGAATGFALTQPPALALLVFVALGLGLAAPFLLLGFVPALGARLPRPGAWMDTFKQLLAFPLYLSSAWLVWVLARQVGADGAGVALFGLVLIALSLWSAGRHAPIFHVISIVAVIAALALLGTAPLRSTSAPTTMTAAGGVQPYSADRLAKLRAQHRIVFVNFTADWCLTCKVNESVALESARVQDAFRTHNVVWLEGDWTRYDPSITQVLQQFGRSGVPLYLLYDGDSTPRVLPQLLTPDVVLEALGALPLASGGTTPSAAPQPPA